ncbi:hypothetical protein CPB85DRAFT_1345451, partial [Mucidula mucida]
MNPGRLIMACRSKDRGQAAVDKLASETGFKVELWLVDLASFASMSSFADKFDKDGGRTAAQFSTTPRLVTVASGVHYWAVIDQELIEAPALLAKLSDETYCKPSGRLGGTRYNICKLFNVLFTRALQDRLAQASFPVTAVSVCPGYCASELRRNLISESRIVMGVVEYVMVKALAFTAEEGSRQLVYAA